MLAYISMKFFIYQTICMHPTTLHMHAVILYVYLTMSHLCSTMMCIFFNVIFICIYEDIALIHGVVHILV